jgi:uncharacterized protein YjdB
MRRERTRKLFIIGALGALVAVSCNNTALLSEVDREVQQAKGIAVTGVSLIPTTLNLVAGGATSALTATISPSNASNTSVTWKSSAPSVATVSGTGVVTPVASGTTTITVTTASGGYQATCAVTVGSSVPTGVKAAAGNGQITISWTAVSGAASYNLYWSTTGGVSTATGNRITGVTSPYTQTGLTDGTPYYYVITAVTAGAESSASAQVTATPQGPPGAPTLPSAVSGTGQVTISWAAVSGATSYNLYWSTTSGVTTTTGTQIPNVTSPYTQTSLANGTTYYYVVTAVNGAGESTASAQVSAVPQISASGAPTGVSAVAGNGQVTISWTAVSGATGYNLYWSTTSALTTATGNRITGVTNPYTHTGLTNGTTYYYVVTAVNGAGESAASNQASAIPQIPVLPAPTGVSAVSGNGQVTVSWSAVSGATSYNLYWATTSGVTTTTGNRNAGVGNPFTQTGLTNGTTYYYVVTAVNAGGESAASNPASATPQVPAPSAPTGVGVVAGNAQVIVSWTGVSGASSYNLYWATTSGVTTATGTKILGVASPYTQTGLTNGTTYYYVLTAVNAGGESAASGQVSGVPQAAVAGAPSGLSAVAGNAQVVISWTGVGGATGYNLYWSTSSALTTSTGTKIPGVTSPYTQSALTNGTTYYYVVTAVNAGGESSASPQASATPQVPAPTAPTGVTAVAGNAQVTLRWNPVNGATSYNLYWSTTSGVTTTSGTKIPGITTNPYTQTGRTNGTTYYYMVTAVNAGGESSASSQVSITLPIPVTGVALNKTSDTITSGSTDQLTATFAPANATNQSITWSSSSTSIAAVSSTGVVTAASLGTATITATTGDGGFAAQCAVTVDGTVTYNGNGATSGTVPSAGTYTLGQTVTVPGNSGSLANPGYSFAGWNTAADGSGTPYAVGATFSMPTSNVSLFAMWNKQANGGTTITTPPVYTVTIAVVSGPMPLSYSASAPTVFGVTYTGTASAYAWYLDSSTTVLGTSSTLSITPTVSTYTYGAHVLSVVITDADGLSYAGSLAITVGN